MLLELLSSLHDDATRSSAMTAQKNEGTRSGFTKK